MTTVVPIQSARPAAEIRPERVGVLLVNLGTPDGADAASVRRYLKEFLSDPRVIENQGVLWQLVLNGVILPIRPRRKARDYAKIWNQEKNESPLKTITRAQAGNAGPGAFPRSSGAVVSSASHALTAWVPARLPELNNTRTRSPRRSKTVILQNLPMLSMPAFVRESEAKIIPLSNITPIQ